MVKDGMWRKRKGHELDECESTEGRRKVMEGQEEGHGGPRNLSFILTDKNTIGFV